MVYLVGALPHQDMFDIKVDAPREIRGEFKEISTSVPGIRICEHLPKLAQCADKFAILRGVSHTLAAHELGTVYVNSGNRPIPSLEYPSYGAVVTKELESPKDLPPFVAIPNSAQRSGFLGVQYAPLNTNATPQPGKPFTVRGVALGNGMTINEVERRQNLLQDLDRTFASVEKNSQLLAGLDRFSEQAYAIITSKKAREAFDVSKESPKFAEPFGAEAFGQSCLLATRLVESGVRFVSISLGGWDTHQDNFTRLKTKQLPTLDTGLAALLNGLAEKGLLSSTAVMVTGEFGRTPKINSRSTEGGRDHYPRCMFMLMAGGGVRGGQVIGETDDIGWGITRDPVHVHDLQATILHCLGFDHEKLTFHHAGRDYRLTDVFGEVVHGVLA